MEYKYPIGTAVSFAGIGRGVVKSKAEEYSNGPWYRVQFNLRKSPEHLCHESELERIDALINNPNMTGKARPVVEV